MVVAGEEYRRLLDDFAEWDVEVELDFDGGGEKEVFWGVFAVAWADEKRDDGREASLVFELHWHERGR